MDHPLILKRDRIEIDFLETESRESVFLSAQDLLDTVASEALNNVQDGTRDKVWPSVNKANISEFSPGLRIIPLERIGVSQGKGGGRVMGAYFFNTNDEGNERSRSFPFILKTATAGKQKRLKGEWENAEIVRTFAAQKDRFAIPFHFHSGEQLKRDCSVLWSKFTTNKTLWRKEDDRYWLGVDDLRSLLRGESQAKVSVREIVNEAIVLLEPLHTKGRQNCTSHRENTVQHYVPYLRGILDENLNWRHDGNHWARRWIEAWGEPTTKEFDQFGITWINPFWLLDRLKREEPRSLQCGVVHGDFHPRNIVVNGYGETHIIDFGWSGDDKHIGHDFSVLECNLRFFVQKPFIPFNDVLALSRWIGKDAEAPVLSCVEARARAEAVSDVRKAAKRRFGADSDWMEEYVIPMFLVSLGLLKHMADCENQIAAQTTILSLADFIWKKRPGGKT